MNIDNTVLAHLHAEYDGVLSHEEILDHYKRYVDFIQARDLITRFKYLPVIPRNLLDIGCGYGSFVIAARQTGIDAQGIDISEFEIYFARDRLVRFLSESADSSEVFLIGDGATLELPQSKFDVVTAWNLLEHVSDRPSLLDQIYRSLIPGGSFHFICPNYASFRKEAHYRVMWVPYLNKKWGHRYLKVRSRNPSFFDIFIFPVYKHTLMLELKKTGFTVGPPQHRLLKLQRPDLIHSRYLRSGVIIARRLGLVGLLRKVLIIWVKNPFTRGIDLIAQK